MTPPQPPPPPEDPDPALGRVIRRLREEQGLVPLQLARRAGIEESALARIEAGNFDPPWASVEALANGLGVSVEEIAAQVLAEEDATEAP